MILTCSSAVVLEVDMGRSQNFHILIKRIKCTLRGLFVNALINHEENY